MLVSSSVFVKFAARYAAGAVAIMILASCAAPPQSADAQPVSSNLTGALEPASSNQPEKFIVPLGVDAQPMQLDRITFRGPRDQVIGAHKYHVGCALTVGPLLMNSSRVDVDPSSYADIFNEVMNDANYNVVGDTNALFEDREADTAAFLVGGLITDIYVETCEPLISSGLIANASMKVEWQVFNTRQRRVVYTTTTAGEAKVSAQLNGGVVAMMNSFENSVENLLFDEGYYQTVTSGGAPSMTEAPDDVTTISAIPLEAGRFQDEITLTRARVATILRGKGHGSGFFIADDLLLTNEHVVGGSNVVIVKLVTGRELVGQIVATSAGRDVALVRTEPSGLGGLAVNTSEPTIGSQVFVIGSPMDPDLESTVSAGIISAFRTEDDLRYIQSDVNVLPGNSGGPMFDDKGNVIAITVIGMFGRGSGLNLFIPIKEALAALNIQVVDD